MADKKRARAGLIDIARRARPGLSRILDAKRTELSSQAKLLETLSYQATLSRGYAIVRDKDGKVLRTANSVAAAPSVDLTLSDGSVELRPSGAVRRNRKPNPTPPTRAACSKPLTRRRSFSKTVLPLSSPKHSGVLDHG